MEKYKEIEKSIIKKFRKDIWSKFVKAVIPGDVLNVCVTKSKSLGPITTFDCKVLVDGNIYSKGTLAFTKVGKDTIYTR